MAFGGETAESYYDEGLTASMKGELEQAVKHLRRAIELEPNFHAALQQLGKCYLRLGEPARAIECLQRVIAAKPGQLPARIELGYALLDAGNPGQAERTFTEILDVKRNHARALLGLAYCSFAQGDWERAMQRAQSSTLQGGANFAAFFLLGRAARLCGRLDISNESLQRAESQIEKSIETSPDQPEGYFLRGEVLFARENFAAALENYRGAEERTRPGQRYTSYGEHFGRIDVMARRAVCLQRLDRVLEAQETGRQILALDPGHKLGRALAQE